MTKPAGTSTDARDNFHKLLAANKKAAQRNNVVLLEACLTGKLNYIKTSLDAGADIHHSAEDHTTPLLRCCQLSPAEAEKCIRYLVKRGADTNFQDKYGRTAISHMAEQGKELIVDILLNKCDADPTTEDVKGNTPLMYAVSSGNVNIVGNFIGYFLAIGFPIDKRNLVGNTPLLLAAKLGKFDCAKMLVELGAANIHLRDLDHFRSAVDWMRLVTPQHLQEFSELDPILCRKRESAKRRTTTALKPKYRVLSDFFLDGKMPSCWRSSSKGSQEPRKHTINRTICIVAGEDDVSPVTVKEVPKPEHLLDYDDTIDTILSSLSDTPLLNPANHPAYETHPRSMFDIPTREIVRPSVNENVGRFVDSRCDSVMSVVSAPSPTLPVLLDELQPDHDLSPTSPTPNIRNKRNANHRKMERRRSIDNSQILSRPQTSSPIVSSPIRRTTRSTTIPADPLSKVTAQSHAAAARSTPPARGTPPTTLSSDPLRNPKLQRSVSENLKRGNAPEGVSLFH